MYSSLDTLGLSPCRLLEYRSLLSCRICHDNVVAAMLGGKVSVSFCTLSGACDGGCVARSDPIEERIADDFRLALCARVGRAPGVGEISGFTE